MINSHLPDTPQPTAVRRTTEHQYFLAGLDVDREDLQAVADVGLIEACHIKPECRPPLVLLFELFCDCLQSKELGSTVVVP